MASQELWDAIDSFDYKEYLKRKGVKEDQIPETLDDGQKAAIFKAANDDYYTQLVEQYKSDPFMKKSDAEDKAREKLLEGRSWIRPLYGLWEEEQTAEEAYKPDAVLGEVMRTNGITTDIKGNLNLTSDVAGKPIDDAIGRYADYVINNATKYNVPELDGVSRDKFIQEFKYRNGLSDFETVETFIDHYQKQRVAQMRAEREAQPDYDWQRDALTEGWIGGKRMAGRAMSYFTDVIFDAAEMITGEDNRLNPHKSLLAGLRETGLNWAAEAANEQKKHGYIPRYDGTLQEYWVEGGPWAKSLWEQALTNWPSVAQNVVPAIVGGGLVPIIGRQAAMRWGIRTAAASALGPGGLLSAGDVLDDLADLGNYDPRERAAMLPYVVGAVGLDFGTDVLGVFGITGGGRAVSSAILNKAFAGRAEREAAKQALFRMAEAEGFNAATIAGAAARASAAIQARQILANGASFAGKATEKYLLPGMGAFLTELYTERAQEDLAMQLANYMSSPQSQGSSVEQSVVDLTKAWWDKGFNPRNISPLGDESMFVQDSRGAVYPQRLQRHRLLSAGLLGGLMGGGTHIAVTGIHDLAGFTPEKGLKEFADKTLVADKDGNQLEKDEKARRSMAEKLFATLQYRGQGVLAENVVGIDVENNGGNVIASFNGYTGTGTDAASAYMDLSNQANANRQLIETKTIEEVPGAGWRAKLANGEEITIKGTNAEHTLRELVRNHNNGNHPLVITRGFTAEQGSSSSYPWTVTRVDGLTVRANSLYDNYVFHDFAFNPTNNLVVDSLVRRIPASEAEQRIGLGFTQTGAINFKGEIHAIRQAIANSNGRLVLLQHPDAKENEYITNTQMRVADTRFGIIYDITLNKKATNSNATVSVTAITFGGNPVHLDNNVSTQTLRSAANRGALNTDILLRAPTAGLNITPLQGANQTDWHFNTEEIDRVARMARAVIRQQTANRVDMSIPTVVEGNVIHVPFTMRIDENGQVFVDANGQSIAVDGINDRYMGINENQRTIQDAGSLLQVQALQGGEYEVVSTNQSNGEMRMRRTTNTGTVIEFTLNKKGEVVEDSFEVVSAAPRSVNRLQQMIDDGIARQRARTQTQQQTQQGLGQIRDPDLTTYTDAELSQLGLNPATIREELNTALLDDLNRRIHIRARDWSELEQLLINMGFPRYRFLTRSYVDTADFALGKWILRDRDDVNFGEFTDDATGFSKMRMILGIEEIESLFDTQDIVPYLLEHLAKNNPGRTTLTFTNDEYQAVITKYLDYYDQVFREEAQVQDVPLSTERRNAVEERLMQRIDDLLNGRTRFVTADEVLRFYGSFVQRGWVVEDPTTNELVDVNGNITSDRNDPTNTFFADQTSIPTNLTQGNYNVVEAYTLGGKLYGYSALVQAGNEYENINSVTSTQNNRFEELVQEEIDGYMEKPSQRVRRGDRRYIDRLNSFIREKIQEVYLINDLGDLVNYYRNLGLDMRQFMRYRVDQNGKMMYLGKDGGSYTQTDIANNPAVKELIKWYEGEVPSFSTGAVTVRIGGFGYTLSHIDGTFIHERSVTTLSSSGNYLGQGRILSATKDMMDTFKHGNVVAKVFDTYRTNDIINDQLIQEANSPNLVSAKDEATVKNEIITEIQNRLLSSGNLDDFQDVYGSQLQVRYGFRNIGTGINSGKYYGTNGMKDIMGTDTFLTREQALAIDDIWANNRADIEITVYHVFYDESGNSILDHSTEDQLPDLMARLRNPQLIEQINLEDQIRDRVEESRRLAGQAIARHQELRRQRQQVAGISAAQSQVGSTPSIPTPITPEEHLLRLLGDTGLANITSRVYNTTNEYQTVIERFEKDYYTSVTGNQVRDLNNPDHDIEQELQRNGGSLYRKAKKNGIVELYQTGLDFFNNVQEAADSVILEHARFRVAQMYRTSIRSVEDAINIRRTGGTLTQEQQDQLFVLDREITNLTQAEKEAIFALTKPQGFWISSSGHIALVAENIHVGHAHRVFAHELRVHATAHMTSDLAQNWENIATFLKNQANKDTEIGKAVRKIIDFRDIQFDHSRWGYWEEVAAYFVEDHEGRIPFAATIKAHFRHWFRRSGIIKGTDDITAADIMIFAKAAANYGINHHDQMKRGGHGKSATDMFSRIGRAFSVPEDVARMEFDAVSNHYASTERGVLMGSTYDRDTGMYQESNLNDAHWNLVRTPFYKKWFGDWEMNPATASKIVDTNGEPLLIVHNTQHDYSAYDAPFVGDNGFFGHSGQYVYGSLNANIYDYRFTDRPRKALFLNVRNPLSLHNYEIMAPIMERLGYEQTSQRLDLYSLAESVRVNRPLRRVLESMVGFAEDTTVDTSLADYLILNDEVITPALPGATFDEAHRFLNGLYEAATTPANSILVNEPVAGYASTAEYAESIDDEATLNHFDAAAKVFDRRLEGFENQMLRLAYNPDGYFTELQLPHKDLSIVTQEIITDIIGAIDQRILMYEETDMLEFKSALVTAYDEVLALDNVSTLQGEEVFLNLFNLALHKMRVDEVSFRLGDALIFRTDPAFPVPTTRSLLKTDNRRLAENLKSLMIREGFDGLAGTDDILLVHPDQAKDAHEFLNPFPSVNSRRTDGITTTRVEATVMGLIDDALVEDAARLEVEPVRLRSEYRSIYRANVADQPWMWSNLDEYSWIMVRTPSFKQQYGEWQYDPTPEMNLDYRGEPVRESQGFKALDRILAIHDTESVKSMNVGFYFSNIRSEALQRLAIHRGDIFLARTEALAMQMFRDGYTAEEIKYATGWQQEPITGEWSYELSNYGGVVQPKSVIDKIYTEKEKLRNDNLKEISVIRQGIYDIVSRVRNKYEFDEGGTDDRILDILDNIRFNPDNMPSSENLELVRALFEKKEFNRVINIAGRITDLKAEGNTPLMLTDVYDQEELYIAYPFLRSVHITIFEKGSPAWANYSRLEIGIRKDRFNNWDSEDIFSSLIHEIQHLIQAHHGWDAYTSFQYIDKNSSYIHALEKSRRDVRIAYFDQLSMVERVSQRLIDVMKNRGVSLPVIFGTWEDVRNQIEHDYSGILNTTMDVVNARAFDLWSDIYDVPSQYRTISVITQLFPSAVTDIINDSLFINDEYDVILDSDIMQELDFNEKIMNDFISSVTEYNRLKNVPYDFYWRHAREFEARYAAANRNLTQEELRRVNIGNYRDYNWQSNDRIDRNNIHNLSPQDYVNLVIPYRNTGSKSFVNQGYFSSISSEAVERMRGDRKTVDFEALKAQDKELEKLTVERASMESALIVAQNQRQTMQDQVTKLNEEITQLEQTQTKKKLTRKQREKLERLIRERDAKQQELNNLRLGESIAASQVRDAENKINQLLNDPDYINTVKKVNQRRIDGINQRKEAFIRERTGDRLELILRRGDILRVIRETPNLDQSVVDALNRERDALFNQITVVRDQAVQEVVRMDDEISDIISKDPMTQRQRELEFFVAQRESLERRIDALEERIEEMTAEVDLRSEGFSEKNIARLQALQTQLVDLQTQLAEAQANESQYEGEFTKMDQILAQKLETLNQLAQMDGEIAAEAMEQAGKDAATILLVTGFERDNSGKWWYRGSNVNGKFRNPVDILYNLMEEVYRLAGKKVPKIYRDAHTKLQTLQAQREQEVQDAIKTGTKVSAASFKSYADAQLKHQKKIKDFFFVDLSKGFTLKPTPFENLLAGVTDNNIRQQMKDARNAVVRNGFIQGSNGYLTLKDVYEDDDLYKAYPFLQDLRITFWEDGKQGWFRPGTASYSAQLNISPLLIAATFRQALIHEIQHAIQWYEGVLYSYGTTPYGADLVELQSHLAQFTSFMPEGDVRTITTNDFITNFFTDYTNGAVTLGNIDTSWGATGTIFSPYVPGNNGPFAPPGLNTQYFSFTEEEVIYNSNGEIQEVSNYDLGYFSTITPVAKSSWKAKEELDAEEYITLYRATVMRDGKYYSPMAEILAGEPRPIVLGEWEYSVEHPELIVTEKGKEKFRLIKKDGGTVSADYAPYIHSSLSPLNDQFITAYRRPIAVLEIRVPKSEVSSGYRAEKAKKSVGWSKWRSGPVASKLGNVREVMLSRYAKPIRALSDTQVAERIREINPELFVKGKNAIPIPINVVTPGLLRELVRLGATVGEPSGFKTQYPAQLAEKNRLSQLAEDIRQNGITSLYFSNRPVSGGYFSRVPQGQQKQADVVYPDFTESQVQGYFSLSKKNREEAIREMQRPREGRPDLSETQMNLILDELDKYDQPKMQKLMLKWMLNGSIAIPISGREHPEAYQVKEAMELAAKMKIDPFQFNSPVDILNRYKELRPDSIPISPESVPELELDTRIDHGDGIVSYQVQDDEAGQQAVRRIINSHWGKNWSNWCLTRANTQGELQQPEAWDMWSYYTGLPKRVAFKNNKIISLMAADKGQEINNALETLISELEYNPEAMINYSHIRTVRDAIRVRRMRNMISELEITRMGTYLVPDLENETFMNILDYFPSLVANEIRNLQSVPREDFIIYWRENRETLKNALSEAAANLRAIYDPIMRDYKEMIHDPKSFTIKISDDEDTAFIATGNGKRINVPSLEGIDFTADFHYDVEEDTWFSQPVETWWDQDNEEHSNLDWARDVTEGYRRRRSAIDLNTTLGYFSLGGPQGAERYLGTDEYQITAQRMRDMGEDPLKIKLATGYEYDETNQTWRYEISNIDRTLKKDNLYELLGVQYQIFNEASREGDLLRNGEEYLEYLSENGYDAELEKYTTEGKTNYLYLEDVIDLPEIYKAYPDARRLRVLLNIDRTGIAAYSPRDKEITINSRYLLETLKKTDTKEIEESVIHELQHYIQDVEGLQRGTSIDKEASKTFFISQEFMRRRENIQSQIKQAEDSFRKSFGGFVFENYLMYLTEEKGVTFDEKGHAHYENGDIVQLGHISSSFDDPTEVLRHSDLYYMGSDAFIESHRNYPKQFGDFQRLIRDLFPNLYYFLEDKNWEVRDPETLNDIMRSVEQLRSLDEEESALFEEERQRFREFYGDDNITSPIEAYYRNPGEVEARRAEARINMTQNEIRNSLFSEQPIFYFSRIGSPTGKISNYNVDIYDRTPIPGAPGAYKLHNGQIFVDPDEVSPENIGRTTIYALVRENKDAMSNQNMAALVDIIKGWENSSDSRERNFWANIANSIHLAGLSGDKPILAYAAREFLSQGIDARNPQGSNTIEGVFVAMLNEIPAILGQIARVSTDSINAMPSEIITVTNALSELPNDPIEVAVPNLNINESTLEAMQQRVMAPQFMEGVMNDVKRLIDTYEDADFQFINGQGWLRYGDMMWNIGGNLLGMRNIVDQIMRETVDYGDYDMTDVEDENSNTPRSAFRDLASKLPANSPLRNQATQTDVEEFLKVLPAYIRDRIKVAYKEEPEWTAMFGKDKNGIYKPYLADREIIFIKAYDRSLADVVGSISYLVSRFGWTMWDNAEFTPLFDELYTVLKHNIKEELPTFFEKLQGNAPNSAEKAALVSAFISHTAGTIYELEYWVKKTSYVPSADEQKVIDIGKRMNDKIKNLELKISATFAQDFANNKELTEAYVEKLLRLTMAPVSGQGLFFAYNVEHDNMRQYDGSVPSSMQKWENLSHVTVFGNDYGPLYQPVPMNEDTLTNMYMVHKFRSASPYWRNVYRWWWRNRHPPMKRPGDTILGLENTVMLGRAFKAVTQDLGVALKNIYKNVTAFHDELIRKGIDTEEFTEAKGYEQELVDRGITDEDLLEKARVTDTFLRYGRGRVLENVIEIRALVRYTAQRLEYWMRQENALAQDIRKMHAEMERFANRFVSDWDHRKYRAYMEEGQNDLHEMRTIVEGARVTSEQYYSDIAEKSKRDLRALEQNRQSGQIDRKTYAKERQRLRRTIKLHERLDALFHWATQEEMDQLPPQGSPGYDQALKGVFKKSRQAMTNKIDEITREVSTFAERGVIGKMDLIPGARKRTLNENDPHDQLEMAFLDPIKDPALQLLYNLDQQGKITDKLIFNLKFGENLLAGGIATLKGSQEVTPIRVDNLSWLENGTFLRYVQIDPFFMDEISNEVKLQDYVRQHALGELITTIKQNFTILNWRMAVSNYIGNISNLILTGEIFRLSNLRKGSRLASDKWWSLFLSKYDKSVDKLTESSFRTAINEASAEYNDLIKLYKQEMDKLNLWGSGVTSAEIGMYGQGGWEKHIDLFAAALQTASKMAGSDAFDEVTRRKWQRKVHSFMRTAREFYGFGDEWVKPLTYINNRAVAMAKHRALNDWSRYEGFEDTAEARELNERITHAATREAALLTFKETTTWELSPDVVRKLARTRVRVLSPDFLLHSFQMVRIYATNLYRVKEIADELARLRAKGSENLNPYEEAYRNLLRGEFTRRLIGNGIYAWGAAQVAQYGGTFGTWLFGSLAAALTGGGGDDDEKRKKRKEQRENSPHGMTFDEHTGMSMLLTGISQVGNLYAPLMWVPGKIGREFYAYSHQRTHAALTMWPITPPTDNPTWLQRLDILRQQLINFDSDPLSMQIANLARGKNSFGQKITGNEQFYESLNLLLPQTIHQAVNIGRGTNELMTGTEDLSWRDRKKHRELRMFDIAGVKVQRVSVDDNIENLGRMVRNFASNGDNPHRRVFFSKLERNLDMDEATIKSAVDEILAANEHDMGRVRWNLEALRKIGVEKKRFEQLLSTSRNSSNTILGKQYVGQLLAGRNVLNSLLLTSLNEKIKKANQLQEHTDFPPEERRKVIDNYRRAMRMIQGADL